jgi:Zn-dependent protease with chaperone function
MAIVAPHLMRLQSAAPATAALVWLLAIALRALVAVGGGLFLVFYLPGTALLAAVAEWCFHEILPTFAAHLAPSTHPVVHVAVAIQVAALTASLVWLTFGSARAWIGLRRTLSHTIGEGPLGSTVIADDDILVAVPTVGPPRILISHTALEALDGDELRASLEHERGHIERRHRPVMLAATLLSAVARPLPGTRAAHGQLVFSLERDADEYAVRKTRNPLALASAICKALGAVPRPIGAALTGRGKASARLTYLLEGQQAPRRARPEYAARALAVLLAALVMLLAASLPAWAASDSPAPQPASACAG